MSISTPPTASSPRFYDLDALRAFAMFLGVVLHTSLFLIPDTPWPVQDPASDEAGEFYKTLNGALHGFRMPVFFLLSGFFSALLWQRRGLRPLFVQRLQRIGIPLAAGCVTIMPLIVIIVITFDPARVEAEGFPLWILPLIGLFDMGHLWFLWFLLLMAAGFVVLVKLGLQFRNPLIWWLAIPLTFGFQLLMEEPVFGADSIFGVHIPAIEREIALLPNPVLLGYYSLFFIFGVFFYQRAFVVQRWWTVAMIPAAVMFAAGTYFLYGNSDEPQLLASAPFQTAFAWLMCFGMLGLFHAIAARESFWVRYLSDASYWMYLVHVPLVMAGHILVIGLPVHYHLKALLVCGGATLILLLTYQIGVRYTFIGRALNGRRTRRRATGGGPGRPTPATDAAS